MRQWATSGVQLERGHHKLRVFVLLCTNTNVCVSSTYTHNVGSLHACVYSLCTVCVKMMRNPSFSLSHQQSRAALLPSVQSLGGVDVISGQAHGKK